MIAIDEQPKTIFENMIKIELSQAQLEHLIELLREELESSGSISTMLVYLPFYQYLEEVLENNKL